MLRGAVTYIVLQLLVVLQAYLAYRDGFLTVGQMRENGVDRGIPFIWHFGMWGDALILSALAAVIVGKYSARWRARSVITAVLTAILVSALLAWLWVSVDMPGAHAHEHRTTPAGFVHLGYMIMALSIFFLLFLSTPEASDSMVWTAGALILAHLFAGTHLLLGLTHTIWNYDWYPNDPLKGVPGWLALGLVGYGIMFRILTLKPQNPGAYSPPSCGNPAMVHSLSHGIATLPENNRQARLAFYRQFRVEQCERWAHLGQAELEAREAQLDDAIEWVEERSPQPRFVERIRQTLSNALGTPENQLAFLDTACNLLTSLTLLKIFVLNYRLADYFGQGVFSRESWGRYLTDHGGSTVVLLTIIVLYYLSRRSAKTELAVARQLFSPSRMPSELIGTRLIWAMVSLFTAGFLSAAWWAHDTRVVSACIAAIYSMNFGNHILSRTNLRKYFAQPQLKPPRTDEHYEFIMRRRRVAQHYLFGHRHVLKEAVVVTGSICSLVLSSLGPGQSASVLVVAAQAILVVVLVGNEILTFKWRSARNTKLKFISDDQNLSDHLRVIA
jgi:hypothetical protein